jgi:tRNA-splicing ligase RtcB
MKVVNTERVPIKMWLDDLEEGALEQAKNLANLPFVYKWVALMPDAHFGFGVPIGSVVATKGVVLIGAIGVDIGCGMNFIPTNIPIDLLYKDTGTVGPLIKGILGNIKRNVPVGFEHHKTPQPCTALDLAEERYEHLSGELLDELPKGHYQVGTLGSNNHFIEIQKDENDLLCIMLHSGSRNFGKKICDHFTKIAKDLNAYWYSSVDPKLDLHFLPMDSPEGLEYFDWMNLALAFAAENRKRMMQECISVVLNMVKKYDGFSGIELGEQVDILHNFAAMENHYGQNVLVHRKGATKATEKTVGIIPGSMGTNSYIVQGLGNPESFMSCSHGAGRRMGRKEAVRTLDFETEKKKLEGIITGMTNKDKLAEAPGSYKDILRVMSDQCDLVKIIKTLRPVASIKG